MITALSQAIQSCDGAANTSVDNILIIYNSLLQSTNGVLDTIQNAPEDAIPNYSGVESLKTKKDKLIAIRKLMVTAIATLKS